MNRKLVIHFMDGSKQTFSFPQQANDESDLAKRVQQMLDQDQVLIEAEGTLFAFPKQNIKFAQAFPSPEKLPDSVIQGAFISE